MRINHNIAALNTYRQLSINTTSGSKSLEKLSSGFRINRAGDDAAGLAISEKMRGQIRGLDQANRNSQDAISLIQTAEGALNETHSILQRMRELAVQSASDTNTDDDRSEIQKEIQQLTEEIKRISTDTEFNTKKLLNGDIANTTTFTPANGVISASLVDNKIAEGNYSLAVTAVNVGYTLDSAGATNISAVATGTAAIGMGKFTLTLSDASAADHFNAVLTDASGNVVASSDDEVLTNLGAAETLDIGGLTFSWNSNAGSSNIAAGAATVTVDMDATFTLTGPDSVAGTPVAITGNETGGVTVDGLQIGFSSKLTATTTAISVDINELTFQIGANEGQEVALGLNDMSAVGLGVNGIDLSSQSTASTAISTIDDALGLVSAERAMLGAMQNRLEHTINNLGTTSENLTASESRVRDVDMAKEMMEFTKNNILQQAATAMLAQANQQPQGVLQLLQ